MPSWATSRDGSTADDPGSEMAPSCWKRPDSPWRADGGLQGLRSAGFADPGGDGVAGRVHADVDRRRLLPRGAERLGGRVDVAGRPERVARRRRFVVRIRVGDDRVAGGVDRGPRPEGGQARFVFLTFFNFLRALAFDPFPANREEADGRLKPASPACRTVAITNDGLGQEIGDFVMEPADDVGEGFRRVDVAPGDGDVAAGADRELEFAGESADRRFVDRRSAPRSGRPGLARHSDRVPARGGLELPPEDVQVAIRGHRHPRFGGA